MSQVRVGKANESADAPTFSAVSASSTQGQVGTSGHSLSDIAIHDPGEKLIPHEAVHVVQQGSSRVQS